ncbi:MAG: dihydrofolate reductase family protein [Caldilineales bacterium]
MDTVQELYPVPQPAVALRGLYLAHDIRQLPRGPEGAFVYANFVVSLDGRIAVPRGDDSGEMQVPAAIANDRDWRLFQELAVQADVLLSSGRYLRDYAAGKAQEILQVYRDPRFADLAQWRQQRGLSRQPAIAVLSHELDFPLPPALMMDGRRVLVITPRRAAVQRVAELRAAGVEVVVTDDEQALSGAAVVNALIARGLPVIYSAAGPKVLHLLLAARCLQRLYLTLAGRVLGGEPYAGVVQGPLLMPPPAMILHSACYDPHALDGGAQLLLCYACG